MAEEIYTSYQDGFERIRPNASTYLVIVTRGHRDDMRVLEGPSARRLATSE